MKLLGYYNYTVVLTYAGAAAAICGVFFSASGYPFWGVICLLFAGLTDMFDGKVASTMKRNEDEKAFGIEIDSLCDLISFGVLPIAVGYGIGLSGAVFYISAVFYLLCAIIRLGYFNVDEAQRQRGESTRRKIYYGLPVTLAALIFPLIYGLQNVLGGAMPVIYQAALFCAAAAFVLKFRLQKPHGKELVLVLVIGLAIAALVISNGG
ncbi:MAG: CDP-alcohol phosphatidyltransferase family protein [Oscillospiraceae bacterium]